MVGSTVAPPDGMSPGSAQGEHPSASCLCLLVLKSLWVQAALSQPVPGREGRAWFWHMAVSLSHGCLVFLHVFALCALPLAKALGCCCLEDPRSVQAFPGFCSLRYQC